MPSKQQDVVKPDISPVLFINVDGESMTFYLRPGPVKCDLQPLIKAGGGLLCNVQQPGAVLLIDPAERGSVTESTAHRYISTQYIRDCVEKGEQLNVEDYRLNPEAVPNQSAKRSSNKESSAANLAGRAAYTSEEDAAILKYVNEHRSEVGGNRLWQEMEKQKVTNHTWQSMKYRYRVRLRKKQHEVVEEKMTEAAESVGKVEENKETDVERPSCAKDVPLPPPAHSAGSDLTQKDSLSTPDDSKQLELVEAQTSISSQEEEMQPVSAHTGEQLAEGTEPETEASKTSQEEPSSECPKDFHLFLPDTQEPETQEKQTVISTQKESVPEDSPVAHSVSQDVSPQKKLKEKRNISPEQPQRRRTRRQLQLDELLGPEPYCKKLRSSPSSASSSSSSPQLLRRIKPTVRSASWRDTTAEQPPSKTARGKGAPVEQDSKTAAAKSDVAGHESAAAVQESDVAEHESAAAVQESDVAEHESAAAVQESDVAEHESAAAVQESDVAEHESAAAVQESDAAVQENEVEMQTSDAVEQETQQEEIEPSNVQKTAEPDAESVSVPQKAEKKKEKRKLGILEAATKEFEDDSESDEDETSDLQKETETAALQPTSSEPSSNTAADAASAQSNPEYVPSPQDVVSETQIQASTSNFPPQIICPASKPHQFIFDRESQEEEAQSTVSEETEVPPAPKETVNENPPYSLTQNQLEEDKRRITELMNETNQDLFSVTKALLKASGDFSAALNLLMNPGCTSGPIWDRHDDNLLLAADPEIRQQLQEKYGEEALVKRILFLEVEG
ncbi:telomeric repeat-binding factor 2-interacting protein 1 isoform X2 [Halichoeres trimaculatus]|uniref:telomeric repeat-binding factor 2-interacting protein 1 isoform X2 n=1 Tax=Halichoeres trimaculatus TaxID=147232 RepID=UPI003D9E4DD5